MTNAAGEFLHVPASVGHRARRVRPEDDPRLTEERRKRWRRVQRFGRLGYTDGVWFVPDDGEASRVEGVRATYHGRPGFAVPLAAEARPMAGKSRPLLPGRLYRFRPDSGEPPLVLYDFALELRQTPEEREAERELRRSERVKWRRQRS